MRPDGRENSELRPVRIRRSVLKFPAGSARIDWGDTSVLCTASVQEGSPAWIKEGTHGWATAEYSMLPGSTPGRKTRGRADGRTHEIQRLIGRSMRAVLDLTAFPGHTIWIDCDVLQADGGTRTAAITGAFVALVQALHALKRRGIVAALPLREQVAAVSIAIVGGRLCLDPDYREDVAADVDMNVVMTGDGRLIEVQGTAEGAAFSRAQLGRMLGMASRGCEQLFALQRRALGRLLPRK